MTANERMYIAEKNPQFMSYQNWDLNHSNRNHEAGLFERIPTPDLKRNDDQSDKQDEQDESKNSEISFDKLSPARNLFSRDENEVKNSKIDKKSCVSSKISYGFMKRRNK